MTKGKNSVEMTGAWSAAAHFHKTQMVAMRMRHQTVMRKEAEKAVEEIKRCIETEGASVGATWEPLSQWTHFEKGTTNVLKDTKTLYDSIVVRKKGPLHYEAGVSPTAYYPDGKQVLPIAKTLEFGAVVYVEMTARMAAFLALRAKELGIAPSKTSRTPIGGSMIIRIPSRPFMLPTEEKFFTPMAIATRVTAQIFKPFAKAFDRMKRGKR